jgi:uncharacterized iron-regulated protein
VDGVLDARESREVSFETMVEDLASVPVVYVGESHTNAEHHEIQRRIIEALALRRRGVMVGMEMLQRPYQEVVDRWTDGSLDEGTFLREVHWYDQWGDWRLYAPILRLAKERGLRVAALHLPDLGPGGALSREIAKSGIDGLPPWMRSQLPAEIDLSSRAHRAAIRAIYQGHPGGKIDEARFDRFYQAQVSWDETMAESAAGALAAAPPGSTLVVLAGSMHVKGFLGIPERVRRRNGLDYRVVLPLERDAFPEAGIPLGMGRPADYVLFTEPTPSEPAGRLGVELRGGDATVKTVVQYGAADKAGLQAGDVLLSLDGAPVADVVDLRLALEGRTAGSTVRLRWRRDGEEREAVATLAAPAPFAPPPPAPKDPPPAEEPPK